MLVECIPNFSEGRHQAVIDDIVAAIVAVGDVYILDVSSDTDHNRTVVTIAGEPTAVTEAAYRGIRQATETIDLTQHHGVHPRIGAADVVPFVPLYGVSMLQCVELTHKLAQRVGESLNVPVYLYEASALDPARTNLADIRRGGYKTLQHKIDTDPNMKPDFGPMLVGRAGAVVIGVREPLIAFNVYLNTDDVTVAQNIARTVRESNGGLKKLKALGLLVDGRAQVSMNLIDYRVTSLFTVMQAVRQEAQRLGYTVTDSELIGLAPQSALIDTALQYLGLPSTSRKQTLEYQIGTHMGNYREFVFE